MFGAVVNRLLVIMMAITLLAGAAISAPSLLYSELSLIGQTLRGNTDVRVVEHVIAEADGQPDAGIMPGCPVPSLCKMVSGSVCCGYGLTVFDPINEPQGAVSRLTFIDVGSLPIGGAPLSLLKPPRS